MHLHGSQSVGLWLVHTIWSFQFVDLRVDSTPLAVRVQDAMCVVLLDALFTNITNGTAVETNGFPIYLERCEARGAFLVDRAVPAGRQTAPFYQGRAFADGSALPPSGTLHGVPTTPVLPLRPRPVVAQAANVMAFGAKGDGVADDTAAVRRALASSSTVFFPFGTYRLTDTLALPPDAHIIGEGLVCQFFFLFV